MLWFLENTKSNFGEELALLFAGLILENTKSKLGESLAHLFTGWILDEDFFTGLSMQFVA